MEATDKNHSEPFDPRQTPEPPQVTHPNAKDERDRKEKSPTSRPDKSEGKPKTADTGKRLGDETEITDETTI